MSLAFRYNAGRWFILVADGLPSLVRYPLKHSSVQAFLILVVKMDSTQSLEWPEFILERLHLEVSGIDPLPSIESLNVCYGLHHIL